MHHSNINLHHIFFSVDDPLSECVPSSKAFELFVQHQAFVSAAVVLLQYSLRFLVEHNHDLVARRPAPMASDYDVECRVNR